MLDLTIYDKIQFEKSENMAVNILILGASGMIGNAIFQNLSMEYAVYGTYCIHRPEMSVNRFFRFDVSDKSKWAVILQTAKPDIIVSCLRGDFTDQENRHKELTEYLLKTCGRLIFLSTANVFDGYPFEPHSENDTPYPASGYGQFKYRCEQMLQESLGNQVAIVRLPRVFSRVRVQTLLEKQTPGQVFPLYSNLFMSANTDQNVAKEIRFIIERRLSGIFHLTSKDFVSYQDFYSGIFTKSGRKDIKYQKTAMSTEEYCTELGNLPVSILRGKDAGKIYLGLSSEQDDPLSVFSLSCKEIVETLCS